MDEKRGERMDDLKNQVQETVQAVKEARKETRSALAWSVAALVIRIAVVVLPHL